MTWKHEETIELKGEESRSLSSYLSGMRDEVLDESWCGTVDSHSHHIGA